MVDVQDDPMATLIALVPRNCRAAGYRHARQARSVRSRDRNALDLLAKDSMRDFQELADEAFQDGPAADVGMADIVDASGGSRVCLPCVGELEIGRSTV
jgi:hypothetical protein